MADSKQKEKRNHRYLLPSSFDKVTLSKYRQTMDEILDKRDQLAEKLTLYLDRVDSKNAKSTTNEVLELLSPLALKLKADARPSNGKTLGNEKLPQHSIEIKPVVLAEVTIRNEMDLVPYILYEQSELSLQEIQKEIEKWPYEQKLATLEGYVHQALTGERTRLPALAHVRYCFDMLCDFKTLQEVEAVKVLPSFHHQRLTPRYGYDIPAVIEEAQLADLYEDCFDLSYELYSRLQALGHYNESEYATLMGHRLRWKVTFTAQEAVAIYQANVKASKSARQTVASMFSVVKQAHPYLGVAMVHLARSLDKPSSTE